MNKELVSTFTPTNEQGELDSRFYEDLKIIFENIKPETIEGLIEFKRKTTALENQYGSGAYEVCIEFIKRINDIDESERDLPSNQFKWRTKMLRKQLIEGLKERGFKPSNVYKLVGAAEYVIRLEASKDKKTYEFVRSQPISSQYILSGMNTEGIRQAMNYEDDNREWDRKTDTFISKPLTKKVLEDIKSWNSRNPEENRGRKKSSRISSFNIHDDDPTPITEVVLERSKEDMTQLELIDELVQLVSYLDLKKIYKDKEIIERLNVVSKDLWGVAHLAQHPVPTT